MHVILEVMKALTASLSITGASGLAAGALMVVRPSGSLMHMSTSALAKTPVHTYTLPGVVVMILYGLAPIYVARNYNETAANYYAALALLWIAFEATVFGLFSWLHMVLCALLVTIVISANYSFVRANVSETKK